MDQYTTDFNKTFHGPKNGSTPCENHAVTPPMCVTQDPREVEDIEVVSWDFLETYGCSNVL